MVLVVSTGVLAKPPGDSGGKRDKPKLSKQERYRRVVKAARARETLFLKRAIATEQTGLEQLRHELKAYKGQEKSSGYKRCRDRITLTRKRLAKLKKRLRGLKKGTIEVELKLHHLQLAIGQIGTIYLVHNAPGLHIDPAEKKALDRYFRVEQVLGRREMEAAWWLHPLGPGENELEVKRSTVVRIRGVSTKGMVAGQSLDIGTGLLEVTGTVTAESGTIFILKPFKKNWDDNDQATSKSKKKKASKKKRNKKNKGKKKRKTQPE